MLKKLSALLLVLVLLAVTFAAAETAEPIVEKKTIAPFIDLTWEEVALYGENACNMTATKRNTDPLGYGYGYSVNFKDCNSSCVGGTITATKNSSILLIWQHLLKECNNHFTNSEQLSQIVSSPYDKVYSFSDNDTYLHFSYVNYWPGEYIIIFSLYPMSE